MENEYPISDPNRMMTSMSNELNEDLKEEFKEISKRAQRGTHGGASREA
jgi:hypothetical protein